MGKCKCSDLKAYKGYSEYNHLYVFCPECGQVYLVGDDPDDNPLTPCLIHQLVEC